MSNDETAASELFLAKLKDKCPKLFKDLSSIDIDVGWHLLVSNLALTIEHELDRLDPEIVEQMYCVQIKQKFGGLRFYMNHSTPYIDGAIRLAENLSFHICEVCGLQSASVKVVGGWMTALCQTHFDDLSKKRMRR